jgi:hypothetical protein
MSDPDTTRSATDKDITERAQGAPEEAVLGRSPYGTMARLVLFIALFVFCGGLVFYFLNQ